MIAQWESECISRSVLSVAQVQFPAEVEYIRELSQAHCKDTGNINQYSLYCPQVPRRRKWSRVQQKKNTDILLDY